MSSSKTPRYNRYSGGAAAAATSSIPSSPSTPPADSGSGVRRRFSLIPRLYSLFDVIHNFVKNEMILFSHQPTLLPSVLLSALQSRMEASFGPTFSAVASGTKGNAHFNYTLSHTITLSLSLANCTFFMCFQLKDPATTNSTGELPPPQAL